MIITKAFINRFVETLNNAYELRTCGTAKMIDGDEYVIRYEDLNGYTNSIYFSSLDEECQIGYLDYDGKYHWFATMRNISTRTETVFMIDIAICLYRMENHIEEELK